MKKTFQLRIENKNSDRLVEAIKHEIRKYIKRERAKKCPEGFDFWDFDCRFGESDTTAQSVHSAALIASIDAAHSAQWSACYIEIIAKPAKKPATASKAD